MLSNLKRYFRPKSIPEALALLEKNSGSILVIAGGTKLVPSQNDIVQELVDITSLQLSYIHENAGEIRVGATTTLQTVVEGPALTQTTGGLVSRAAQLSHRSKMIRNMATLGGELVSTGPLSVLYCALLVLQAQVRIAGGEEFALAMNIFLNKKGLSGGLLVEIIIPKPSTPSFAAMVPICHQNQNALICACARVTLDKGTCQDVKLAITGTARVPQRLSAAEHALEGRSLTGANIESTAETACDVYKPISDDLASEEYRKEVSRGLVKKTLEQCLEQAEQEL
ncbi:MAG: FAD binding domain-containing protein [bacterium]